MYFSEIDRDGSWGLYAVGRDNMQMGREVKMKAGDGRWRWLREKSRTFFFVRDVSVLRKRDETCL